MDDHDEEDLTPGLAFGFEMLGEAMSAAMSAMSDAYEACEFLAQMFGGGGDPGDDDDDDPGPMGGGPRFDLGAVYDRSDN